MKQKVLLALAAMALVGCNGSTPKDDPNDPFIKATRNYAVRQVKEHLKTDVQPYDIEITKCDYEFESPVRFSVAIAELSKNEYQYTAGNITKKQYTDNKIEWLGKYEYVLETWVYGEDDTTLRTYGEYAKPMYKCVAPTEIWDADGKHNDTETFFIRWGSFDPRDTNEMKSTMEVWEMYYKYQIDNIRYFDESLNYHRHNDRDTAWQNAALRELEKANQN